MKLHMNVELAVTFLKEGKTFVAYAPALDLSTSGNTLKKAEKNMAEAARLFLEEISARGTLDQVLSSLGWVKKQRTKQWMPPLLVSHGMLPLSV
jgi:predicted RNase H-like HicB family nuclease